MYAGKNTPVELPKTGHLHILTNGYVYWENDGKWDKEARRMRDSRVSIGKMADAEKGLFYPNRKYWELFPDEKHNANSARRIPEKTAQLEEPGKFFSRLSYGAYLALKLAAEKIGLLETLKETFPDKWEKIFALTVHFICDECSTAQAFPFWQFDNYCGLESSLTVVEISRLYRDIGADQNGIDSLMSLFRGRYEKSVYGAETAASSSGMERDLAACILDSENHSSSFMDNDMTESGSAKKKDALPDISFAAFVDEMTGVPVSYELFMGSLIDQPQALVAIKNAEHIGFRKIFLVMDRRYCRKDVLNACENVSFACMCPENMPELNEVRSKYASEIKDRYEHFVPAENVYGIKAGDMEVYGKTYKTFLYYDSARAEDERSAIHMKLDMLRVEAESGQKCTAETTRRFAPWLIFENLEEPDPETGRKFRIKDNNEAIQQELNKAGFFMAVSDMDCSAEEIIVRARKRDSYERTFRRAKSHFDFSGVCRTDGDLYKGQMFGCFLALALSSAFCWYIRKYLGFGLTRRTMAHALGILSQYRIEFQKDKTWTPVYALTCDMRTIFQELGIEHPEEDIPAIVSRLKIRL